MPAGTPMSMPGWQDSQARDSQKGEVIGPLTGQIRPPEPLRTGPAGSARRGLRAAQLAGIFADWARSEPTSSSRLWRWSRTEASTRCFAARGAGGARP